MNRTMRTALGLTAVLLAAACGSIAGSDGSAPARRGSPIIGGTEDTTGHPAVVYIQHSAAASGFSCTGTVIGPSVILTAGHCTLQDEACTPGNCQTLAPQGYTVSAGYDPNGAGPDWFFGSAAGAVGKVIGVHTHPQYNGQTLDGDVGIIILNNIAPVTPVAWDSGNSAVYTSGQSATWVGYGLGHHPVSDPGSSLGSGKKRTVTMTITDTSIADRYSYGNATTSICFGDSGGPAIANIAGTDTVIGNTSFVDDSDCSTRGTDMRTVFYSSFISQYANISNTPTPTPTHTPVPTPTPGGDHSKRGPLGINCSVSETPSGAGITLGLAAALAIAIARRRRQ